MSKKNSKKPFFASFLEKQVKEPETITGGTGSLTSALEDNATTQLRDSVTSSLQDQLTKPGLDLVSSKYPSDSDETGEII